ncbi:MAG TPA: hypothetical protein PKD99_02000 [Sphingopyxis sp.]|nr:hypothetical protein [Sphingopyxis sp.]HMP43850.1 hypothetical protein [Sphingopyxis sp.]HMQ19356.1 hypothetical protein [Sphingopyxis sp.]
MKRKIIAAMLGLAACSACTSIETRPTYAVTSAGMALPDHGYRLPMLQYDILVGYKLSSCPGLDANGKPIGLAFKVETVASSDHVAGEAYTVDYSALSSPLKITDFAVEAYPRTGTLKSINAAAEDKTGDFLKSAVEFGISSASLLAPNPLAELAGAQSDDRVGLAAQQLLDQSEAKYELVCTQDTIDAIGAADAARLEIKRLTNLIAPDLREIEAIAMRANVKLSDANDARRLLALHDRHRANVASLEAEQGKLLRAEKKLSFVESRIWPTDPFETRGSIGMSGALRNWLATRVQVQEQRIPRNIYDPERLRAKLANMPADWSPEFGLAVAQRIEATLDDQAEQLAAQGKTSFDAVCVTRDLGECAAGHFSVHAEFLPEHGPLKPCIGKPEHFRQACLSDTGAVAARRNVAHKGIFFRQPQRARLLLCDRARSCREGDPEQLLLTGWDVAPQLGQLRFAPLTNGAFQNNALSLAIREDGTLIKFQYAEKSAILAQAMATAATAATKLDEERMARRKERREALLQYRADIAYERGEVAAQRTEAAAVRTDEIAQIQYEIDKITKEKTLLDLRFPPAKPDPVVEREFLNETARLEALAAQLQWRLAIKQAEEALGKN